MRTDRKMILKTSFSMKSQSSRIAYLNIVLNTGQGSALILLLYYLSGYLPAFLCFVSFQLQWSAPLFQEDNFMLAHPPKSFISSELSFLHTSMALISLILSASLFKDYLFQKPPLTILITISHHSSKSSNTLPDLFHY